MDYTEPNRLENTSETTTSAEQFNQSDFFREHLIRTDAGAYDIKGDDLGPVEMALLETEKRRRGSQAATSREKARADRFELEIQKVREIIPTVDHTVNQIDNSLRYSDPDEYIRLTLEAQRATPYDDAFNTASQQAADEVGQRTLEGEVAEFNSDNPQTPITIQQLELDLPPRLVQEFSEGKMDPQSLLGQAADILYRPTETYNQSIPVTPDLGKVGGQTSPTDDGSNDKLMANYASAIF